MCHAQATTPWKMSDFSKSYFLLAYFLLPILGFILDLFQILTWFFKFYKVSTEPKAYKKTVLARSALQKPFLAQKAKKVKRAVPFSGI